MKDNGSTGPTSKQYLTEVMMPSMYKGENMTNASVIHCLGVDTEETVIESAQYAAPELVIPIKPPKRGMLLPRGKRLQHPRTIRFATGVSIMISRQSAATIEAKRIQLAMEMIISQDYA